MPIYHNANPDQMTFELGGERYKLPSGAECEIPRNLEYCVAARGLALTKGRAPSADAPVVEPTPEVPARVVLPPGVGTYRVLSALNHDLQDYPEGSEITLTVDQAAPLLGHTVEHKNAPADDA